MNTNIHYQIISELYEGQKAKRTQLPYIKHIDDGLLILDDLDADLITKEAWCMHPIFQMPDLKEKVMDSKGQPQIRLATAILAAEYAETANQYRTVNYQSFHDNLPEIPNSRVKKLLTCDKVQNYIELENTRHLLPYETVDRTHRYLLNWLHHLSFDPVQMDYMRTLSK